MLVLLFANIFSQSTGCLFCLFSFAMHKLLSLIISHSFTFAFISVALGDWPKKALVQLMSENVLSVFSSRSFKSLNHFEFSVVYGMRDY